MTACHVAGAVAPPDGDYDADVVILSLDRPEETVAAIQSALEQTGISRHVFIIDQGSQPENLALLAAAVTGRQDATLVALDRNHGVAGGRNRGSALGHGRVIFGLDNDAEFADATTLARAVAALDDDMTLAAVACRIMLAERDADDMSSWGYPTSLLPRSAGSFDTVTFIGAGHAIRRAAWDGYDEALFFCWEEFDFCLRAIDRGWRINRLYIERKWGATWLNLMPRVGFYLIRAARNGLLIQTMRAIPAAIRLSSHVTARRHPPAARNYLQLNDAAHRSHWATMYGMLVAAGFAASQPSRNQPAMRSMD